LALYYRSVIKVNIFLHICMHAPKRFRYVQGPGHVEP
jgi:hypothetical protein